MKLFSSEDFQEEVKAQEPLDVFNEITLEIEDSKQTLEIVTEAIKTTSNDLKVVSSIQSTLESKKRSEASYFVSVENYRPVLKSISDNLGVKLVVPSMEDFRNPYGAEASHQIAVEGLFDYVKKLWEKIRSFFAAFFKKVNMFIRRVMNYDLDLATYEEYVSKMIVKIKSGKLEISDNKVILDSKLPSLLADPGMESVTSEFVLKNGDRKLNELGDILSDKFITVMRNIADKDLKTLVNAIMDLGKSTDLKTLTVEHVKERIDSIKLLATGISTRVFPVQVHNARNLPDNVYYAIQEHFDRNELDNGTTVHALVDDNNYSLKLPKNYNCYFVNYDNRKTFVTSTSENEVSVQNKLTPISSRDNLVKFYENYTKVKKKVDIKRLDSAIDDFDKEINRLTKFMSGSFTEFLEHLKKAVNAFINGGGTRMDLDNMIELTRNAFLSLKGADPRKFQILKAFKADFLNSWNVSEEIRDNLQFSYLFQDNTTDNNYTSTINYLKQMFSSREQDYMRFLQYVIEITEYPFPNVTVSEADVERLKQIVIMYEEFQGFLTNYLTAIQNTIKELTINLGGIYTEMKFETVKYLYQSCKLYK